MALIGLPDKGCVVGRADHSAKTKAHRGREIDVLIFPFERQAAGYSEQRRAHRGKMWSLLFSFRRVFLSFSLFFLSAQKSSAEIPSREASGAAGLEVKTAGRHLSERRGYYCYKFHHLQR